MVLHTENVPAGEAGHHFDTQVRLADLAGWEIYHGRHQGLVRDRITVADLRWAAERLAQLEEQQWLAIFAAGGYSAPQAQPFIDTIGARIAESWDAACDVRLVEEGS